MISASDAKPLNPGKKSQKIIRITYNRRSPLHPPRLLQFARLPHHTLPLCQALHSIIDHLIHNLLGALLLIHHRRGLAHQERARAVHGVVVDVVAEGFKVVLDGDGAFGGEGLDFLGAVFFPVTDVGVVADAEGAALGGGD